MTQIKVGKHNLEISNPEKILFPENGITKLDLVNYYKKISKYILPHVKDRPVTLNRYPNGIGKKNFYQKDASDFFPDWIKQIKITKKEGGSYDAPICNNSASLVYFANLANITPHIWLSKIKQLGKPDRMIFDLDTSNDKFDDVKFAARRIKDFFEKELNFTPFLMTTGSTGLHVVISLKPEYKFDEVREASRKIAKKLAEQFGNKLTIETRKKKRRGRVFLDTARNSFGQTSAAPYSIRAREGAPVATPINWDELNSRVQNARIYNIKNVFRRLSQKEDPWEKFFKVRKSLKPILKKLGKIN